MIIEGNIQLNAVDYILVVDRYFNILFNSRYETRVNLNAEAIGRDEYLSMNFFQAYPSIDPQISSIVECITTGEIVIRKYQQITDFKGRPIRSHNITIPIIRNGLLMGAVELAKDITTLDNMDTLTEEEAKEFDELVEAIKRESEVISFETILTNNTQMLKNIEMAKLLSKTPNPVLIYGETGTGKELIAQAMINYSQVSRDRVVIQNCASMPENLMESILFGTVRGAYTGSENRKGLFEQADGGIIFLDELSAMPYNVQSKLLRVIQDGSFRPLGSSTERKVRAKIIAAMNVDPNMAIKEKILREDLFYRFSSSLIKMIPLRERPEDIDFYVAFYIEHYNRVYNKAIKGTNDELKALFRRYRWEGNVRELKHVIESMVSTARDAILSVRDLPAYIFDKMTGAHAEDAVVDPIRAGSIGAGPGSGMPASLDLNAAIRHKEKELITLALRQTLGNKTQAARLLGIPRQTLNYKMAQLEIGSHA